MVMAIYFDPTIYPLILDKRAEYFKRNPEAKEHKPKSPTISLKLRKAFAILEQERECNRLIKKNEQ